MFNAQLLKAFVMSAAAGAASLAFVPSANAATGFGDTVSTRVSYADLNLDTPEGLDALKARIDFAAQRVCGTRSAQSLIEQRASEQCRVEAVQGTRLPTVEVLSASADSPARVASLSVSATRTGRR